MKVYRRAILIEGLVSPGAPTTAAVIEAYRRKYDWEYQVSQYGDLTMVTPAKALAWRSEGWAGRDSFQTTGCRVFDGPD